MLAILTWRVTEVLRPAEDLEGPIIALPGSDPPPIEIEIGPPPPPPEAVPLEPLIRRNPFWVRASPGGADGAGAADDVVLEVLSIQQQPNGTKMARIQTETATKWYPEGESFESYVLREVNAEEGYIVIWSENLREEIRREVR